MAIGIYHSTTITGTFISVKYPHSGRHGKKLGGQKSCFFYNSNLSRKLFIYMKQNLLDTIQQGDKEDVVFISTKGKFVSL